jgi:transposase
MQIYKRRGVTIMLKNKDKALMALLESERVKVKKCCQEICNRTLRLMKTKQISKRFFGSFCDLIVIKDSNLYNQIKDDLVIKEKRDRSGNVLDELYTITTSKLVKGLFSDIFDQHNFVEDGISNYKRSIVKHSLDRIASSINRNNDAKDPDPRLPIINFKGKKLHISEGLVYDDKTKKLYTPLSCGKKELDIYKYIGKGMVGHNFGGNFVFKYYKDKTIKTIIMKASIGLLTDPKYDPEGFIGFDINQTPIDWITFDDGQKIARPDEMSALIRKNNILTKEVNKKKKRKSQIKKSKNNIEDDIPDINSKQRSKKRKEKDKVLASIQKYTRPFALQIINKAILNKKGIAIDKINTGAKGGEFGQYISEYVQVLCEDMNIPFYVSPSPYTSMTCSKCGYVDKKNRDADKFNCLMCTHSEDSHINAANNIKNVGQTLYNYQLMYSRTTANNINKLILKAEKIQQSMKLKNEKLDSKKNKNS